MWAARYFAPALVASLLLGWPGSAAAGEDGEYPIWWSGRIMLKSLEKIDDRLRAPLYPREDGVEVFQHLFGNDRATRPRATIRDCLSLLRLTSDDYVAGTRSDRMFVSYNKALCRAVTAFKSARPARVSHVRRFFLDRNSVNLLPAMVLLGGSCYGRCRAYAANERRIPLARLQEIRKVKVVTDIALSLETPWSKHTLEIVGRADFDGDGLEDLMVFSNWSAIGGRGTASRYFILGRAAPESVLHVLDAEEHLCSNYQCPLVIDDLPASGDGN